MKIQKILRTIIACIFLFILPVVPLADDKASELKKVNRKGNLIYYSGEIIIEGTFEYAKSTDWQELIYNQVCFFPADKDRKLIPRDEDDSRSQWFCFKDTQQAKKLLGIAELLENEAVCSVSGITTVRIRDYIVDRNETNTNDRAELVQVINKSTIKTKPFTKTKKSSLPWEVECQD